MTLTSKKKGGKPMHAVTWMGKNDLRVEERPRPALTDPVGNMCFNLSVVGCVYIYGDA